VKNTINDLIIEIEKKFPISMQESYDNCGLITGDKTNEIKGVLLTIDITEEVIDEAIEKKFNLIISHHPIIFKPIKKITGNNYIEKVLIKAIKNDIAIYAAHTSVDNSSEGINKYIADLLGLKNYKILDTKSELLVKLVTFVPTNYIDAVRNAIFEAGAGVIGNYDCCSYNIEGQGTFRASENSNPFVGKKGEIHFEKEIRLETIMPKYIQNKVIDALKKTHPYEEIAYDIYPLENKFEKFGAGIIGEIDEIDEIDLLKNIKEKIKLPSIKFSMLLNKKVSKIALCTGAGAFLVDEAIRQKADVFISSEFKYNQYLDVQNKILIVDSGHYETEIFVKNLFYDFITKKITNFAVEFSEKFIAPINYL
jgi:dinuclear metal center YbgI/SA1388 family protein